jgi:4-aminobutyrate aminotransferase
VVTRIARRHGILIIADEVQCGMGRTGKMFAFEHFQDFRPDIIALAKGIASGMPLGVMIARSELMTWGPGAHASTFGGNPVCLAAALETVRLLQSEYLLNATKVGIHLKLRLQRLMDTHPEIGDVRGLGMMLGVDSVKDRDSKGHATDLRHANVAECFKRGLLVLGEGASTIRLSRPLLIVAEQAECASRIISDSISAATA